MLSNKRKAFTMIELVFVIVVLGILAAIAIPRLAATRNDAEIAKGRSDIAALRAAIVSERQTRLMRGESAYISKLDGITATTSADGDSLFDSNGTSTLLQYPIISKNANGHWRKTDTNKYVFKVMNADMTFEYNMTSGRFGCISGTYCGDLTN